MINSQGIVQSPVVREHAGIDDNQVIMKSITLGWPDENFSANAVVSDRKSVDEAKDHMSFFGRLCGALTLSLRARLEPT
ncbi:hypothetical protein HNQ36_005084 [Afipia massiliensis]|uniref:Uncharacterized protein n=1 Tax=Afipia massiliensis TaxID=211460 RepID=A0A840N4V2_9BRAD|nr:hypothetical protein [Afipia massiliensis]